MKRWIWIAIVVALVIGAVVAVAAWALSSSGAAAVGSAPQRYDLPTGGAPTGGAPSQSTIDRARAGDEAAQAEIDEYWGSRVEPLNLSDI